MSISRREFLETAAAGSLAAGSLMADSSAGMPTRVLGKTGARVSILAMGGGSRFLQYEEDQAAEAVHKALDLGVTYIDTCDDYGKDHLSERRIGAAIKGRRDRIFLATKVTTRVPEDVPRVVELSLKCLQVDHVDLLHIHSLTEEDDLARVEAKDGVLDQVLKLRDRKFTRFIGVTSHTNPAVLAKALERHDFDCTQMALNAGTVAMIGGAGGKMVPNPAMTGQLRDPGVAGGGPQEDGDSGDEGVRAGCPDRPGEPGQVAVLHAVTARHRRRGEHAQVRAHRAEHPVGQGIPAALAGRDERSLHPPFGEEQGSAGPLLPPSRGRVGEDSPRGR